MIVKRSSGYGVRVWDKASKTMRWVGTFPTRQEAKDAEARATLKPRRGRPITVAEFADMWLSDYARDAAATRNTYRYAARQIIDRLGHLQLADLDRPAARKLAGDWPRGTTRVARTMFGDAMRDGLIDLNPFSELRLETPRGRKDLEALTEPQIRQLAEIAEDWYGSDYGPEAAAIVLTFGYVGLRAGELCSARRADLDPARRRLTIRWNTDGTGHEKRPKSGKARVVTVAPIVLEAIARCPQRIGEHARLFLTLRERPFTKGTLTYFWRPINTAWQQAGNEPVTPHELRHACATLLLERGVTHADVAVQLGHQDGGHLVRVLYGHPSEEGALDRLGMGLAAPFTAQPASANRRNTDTGSTA